jgi:hypothetical protein
MSNNTGQRRLSHHLHNNDQGRFTSMSSTRGHYSAQGKVERVLAHMDLAVSLLITCITRSNQPENFHLPVPAAGMPDLLSKHGGDNEHTMNIVEIAR